MTRRAFLDALRMANAGILENQTNPPIKNHWIGVRWGLIRGYAKWSQKISDSQHNQLAGYTVKKGKRFQEIGRGYIIGLDMVKRSSTAGRKGTGQPMEYLNRLRIESETVKKLIRAAAHLKIDLPSARRQAYELWIQNNLPKE